MLPSPLHPAIVHFPIVLALLAPLFAIGALYAIRHGAHPLRAWGVTTAACAALALSAWVAVETGQDQEQKVEEIVSEQAIGTHEERAETFLLASSALLVLTSLGLARGRLGSGARIAATVGTLGVVGLAFPVGTSGGDLVYRHGAGSAYASTVPPSGGAVRPSAGSEAREEGEREEHDAR